MRTLCLELAVKPNCSIAIKFRGNKALKGISYG